MERMSDQLAKRANTRLAWAAAGMGRIGVPPLSVKIDLAHVMTGTVKESHGVNYHRHEFYQIQAAMDGKFEFASEHETVVLENGAACLIRPEAPHRWKCLEPGVLFGIDFHGKSDGDNLENSFQFTGQRAILKTSDASLKQTFQELMQIATAPANGWMREQTRFQLGLWLTRIVPTFMRPAFAEEPAIDTSRSESRTDRQVRKIESFISSNLATPLRLADVAREVGMSTRQLTRVYKRARNRTIHDCLMEMRLHEAHRKLESGHAESVKQVAYECGFNQPTHFSRCYVGSFGRNPSDDLAQ